MAENPYAPLNANVVRNLTDKLYEKRKAAALEIEKQVRELLVTKQSGQFDRLLAVMRDLCLAQNGNVRKGGLIGLAAVAIALGKDSQDYTAQLITPVLSCFSDPDSRVRYYSCEALYNIVKVTRGASLNHFDAIFDILCQLSADADQNVRGGVDLLDRLLKDVVTCSETFEIAQLMVLIRERIYSQNSALRRFILSWLSATISSPKQRTTTISFIPEVLDGVFQMLSDAQTGVRDYTETVLKSMLEVARPDLLAQVVNVLMVHAGSELQLARGIALAWLDHFVTVTPKDQLMPLLAAYLTSILPSLAEKSLKASDVNEKLLELVNSDSVIELDSVSEVLLKHMRHPSRETRMAVLHWIQHLHAISPVKMFPYMERLFPVLLLLLTDSSDDVVLLDLKVLSDLCEHAAIDIGTLNLKEEAKNQLTAMSPYLVKFAISLLQMFNENGSLLVERGVMIIRQLCLLLKPTEIFQSLSVLLQQEEDLDFVSEMVAHLNGILFTAPELFDLRERLRNRDEMGIRLFESLYRSWAFQPVSLIGLCLLARCYTHAAELAVLLSQIDVTVPILVELDRLVQLIESPLLAYVRLDLLCASHQRSIATVFSLLLMLLPQTEAFDHLHKRMQCLPAVCVAMEKSSETKEPAGIAFDKLKAQFLAINKRKRDFIRLKHEKLLQNS